MPTKELIEASHIISNNGVIITPTDTLYGLSANIFSEQGVNRIFKIKHRDLGLALPILVSSWGQCLPLIQGQTELGFDLQKIYWPGALTMIFKKTAAVPDYLTAGKDTIAIRMPNHPAPLFLAENLGAPITGTSANLSGEPDALTLEDLSVQVINQVDMVLDVKPSPLGTASTILDLSGSEPVIIRHGALNIERELKAI